MYKITDYTFKKAKEIGVKVQPSTRKNKKIDVYDIKNGDYITSVGQKGYNDYPTYIKEKGLKYANARKEQFYNRFGDKVNKPKSDAFYASKLLW
jgi:hypothetical protein